MLSSFYSGFLQPDSSLMLNEIPDPAWARLRANKTVGGKRHGVEEDGQILVAWISGVQGPGFLQRTFVRNKNPHYENYSLASRLLSRCGPNFPATLWLRSVT
jgi:hypothetical protein